MSAARAAACALSLWIVCVAGTAAGDPLPDAAGRS